MAITAEQLAQEFARRKKHFEEYLRSEDYVKRLTERLKINDAAERSLEARSYVWYLCQRPDNYVEGCKFFINNFGWTFDPRPEHAPHHLPFITFGYQDKAIEWIIDHIDNSKDGLIEKSRDMGISWIVFVWVVIWYWLFRDGVNILLGSYKEKLVDDRTDDSLFGRIDYAINNMPKWLLPAKFNKDKHRTKLKLVNPSNNNLIAGDTMNPDFGRGSRKTAILFDELGSWDYAKDAWESCGDSTSCRIGNSTPKGYNYFASLRESGIDVLTLHWKEHPHKDQSWYEFECARRTPEEVAQELDISYTKSREGQVYPEWNEVYVQKGHFPYDPEMPLYVGWDFGKTDDTAIIWCQPSKKGGYRIIDTYCKNNKNIDFFIPFITGVVPSEGYKYTKDELELIDSHKNWARGTHYGDPAGRFTNQVTDQSVLDVLKESGIIVNFKDEWKHFSVRKSATKRLLMDGIELNNNPRTKYFDMCITQAAYPKVKHEGKEEVRSDKPKHDWTSHYRSSFEYLALGLESRRSSLKSPFDKFKKREVVRTGRGRKSLRY